MNPDPETMRQMQDTVYQQLNPVTLLGNGFGVLAKAVGLDRLIEQIGNTPGLPELLFLVFVVLVVLAVMAVAAFFVWRRGRRYSL